MKLSLLCLSATVVISTQIASQYPAARYHTVDQDHFDGKNIHTWQQAYFVNDTFWKAGSKAPIFVCVGGEGPPLDGSAVVASVHCNVAAEWLAETGALMFAVQHRYYGCHNASACPVQDLSAKDSLHYLSSRQALGDLAAFHTFATQAYGLTAANKWVSWGGSYPGMLAGWFRLKFPHLIHAAVSSSAPVLAALDMTGYNDVTAQAYAVSDNNVGGSDACRQAIADGHATIGTMLQTTKGRVALAARFGLPSAAWLESIKNQKEFAGFGVASFPSQGNDPACTEPACNIAVICKTMTDESIGDEVSRLANVARAQSKQSQAFQQGQQQQHPLQMAARSFVLGTKGTQGGLTGRAAEPQLPSSSLSSSSSPPEEPDYWGYQTCTEFAFYQTCEVGSQCFYTQGLVVLEDYLQACEALGLSRKQVQHNVDYTNSYYGGLTPSGSRVLYPNGEVDPWSSLSILNTTNPGLATLWVKGASHHAWTHPTLPTDQASVVQARQTIRDQVKKWLVEA